ncbi:A disintegrin and metalloproteinase with thrombospondin motifs 5 [Liparis tanakae]|uniref:A disintegrin and metalloproteinase with thrombospondin motifs 5 n=1 Tax=Liparis tanakae TaxID=230148 RepID=A0A4Z2GCK2_9TELE|nr:A disintegrin and metalloproteinase with thrombospondin motifs 5 [Liparis tanakae]
MVRILGALAEGMLCFRLLLLCVVELELGAALSTFQGFYLPPANGSLLTPARRTDGVVRTIDRIYHGGGKVGYLLYLDGRRFQLDMERDDMVLSHHFSPQYVLAMMGDSPAALQRECVYRGTVDSNPESLAVFNLCGGGLEGFFALDHARYTITPIIRAKGHEHNVRALQDKDAESALHVFTRESFSFEAMREGRESCGTRDGRRGRRDAAGKRGRRRGRATRTPRDRESVAEEESAGGHGARGRTRWSRLANAAAPVHGTRSKRSVSRARHVELLLVADDTMTKKYGKELNHYLLTLAAIASKLYGHASIENPIRLTVVKVTVVTEKEKGLDVSKNAAATLKSFCKWQNQQNPLDDDHQQHHDAAILFTRQLHLRRPVSCRESSERKQTPWRLPRPHSYIPSFPVPLLSLLLRRCPPVCKPQGSDMHPPPLRVWPLSAASSTSTGPVAPLGLRCVQLMQGLVGGEKKKGWSGRSSTSRSPGVSRRCIPEVSELAK